MPRTRKFAELHAAGALDMATDSIEVVLVTGAPAELTEEIQFASELTTEHADASYSRQALTNASWTWDTVNHRLEYSHDNPNFGPLAGSTPTYAVYIRNNGGADTANEVLGYFDIPDTAPDGANDYILTVGTEGTIWL